MIISMKNASKWAIEIGFWSKIEDFENFDFSKILDSEISKFLIFNFSFSWDFWQRWEGDFKEI